MNQRMLVAVVTLAAALALTAASSARPVPGTLITASGIGKLKLGMRAETARKLLARVGRPFETRSFGVRPRVRYSEYEYRRSAFGIALYTVGYQGRRGRMRVVRIATHVGAQRTRGGVRVGSPARKLYTLYGRQLQCFDLPGGRGNACALGSRAVRHIVFVVTGGCFATGSREECTAERVSRIVVEEPRLVVAGL